MSWHHMEPCSTLSRFTEILTRQCLPLSTKHGASDLVPPGRHIHWHLEEEEFVLQETSPQMYLKVLCYAQKKLLFADIGNAKEYVSA